ncbi:hypothetical protein BDW42DRAFT_3242 [Aspergillus taichungensis]|uniref:Uncharacterized protein n=1 Tax=Aspergillus taichungensis TaxID=482145 RepID=A0A2J5I649_9EURO|nr:hypothetical protein BDW42DRAFT_3242 [Aspergillus taichungensis]
MELLNGSLLTHLLSLPPLESPQPRRPRYLCWSCMRRALGRLCPSSIPPKLGWKAIPSPHLPPAATMTFNITIDKSDRNSKSSLTDEDESVQEEPLSATVSREHRDPYDEWAHIHYPVDVRPSELARSRRARPQRSPSSESSRSVSNLSPVNNWLICSGDRDKDITVHLDLDAGLDISHDLERLARLSRLGHFYQAIRIFEERLAPHVDFFPVVGEYADLLWEQGNFGHLQEFVSGRLSDPHVEYSPDEVLLLKVIKSLAEIHTKGAVIPALEMTTNAMEHFTKILNRHSSPFRHPTGTQIQLIEACVYIIAHAAAHSNFLETEPFQSLLHWSFPGEDIPGSESKDHGHRDVTRHPTSRRRFWTSGSYQYSSRSPSFSYPRAAPTRDNVPRRDYPQIGPWYRLLIKEGFVWESHRLLRTILTLFGCKNDGQYVDDRGFEEFAQLDDISKAGDLFVQSAAAATVNEQVLLTEFANATLLARFLDDDSAPKTVRAAHSQFYRKAQSLASTILSTHLHLIKSRPYLDWALYESTRGVSTGSPVNQQRPSAVRSSHDKFSGLQSSQRTQSIEEGAGLAQTLSDTFPYGALDTISASAKELGDYPLEKSVLRNVYLLSRDFDQRIQTVQAMTRLHHDTLHDALGYLRCLVDEFWLLDSDDPSNRQGMRKDLHHRLAEFNSFFPCRFDYEEALRHDTDIVFFDDPLLKWMEREVSHLLLKSLGQDVEAELARVQLLKVERHLPNYISSQLEPAVHHEDKSHNDLAAIPGVVVEEKSDRPTRWDSIRRPSDHTQARRAILPESCRSKNSIHEFIQQNRNRRKDKGKGVEESVETNRKSRKAGNHAQLLHEKKPAESESRWRSAEDRANAAEEELRKRQQLLTLKDPMGRKFLFPFDQCRTFTVSCPVT